MAKILLLTLVFAPDGVSTSVLMTELAQELQQHGHELTVLTTTPHYNVEPEARARQPLRAHWGRWLQRSEIDGIRVYHASIPVKGDRVGARLLDYLRFHAISTLAGLVAVGRYDVMLVPSPPLTIGLSAWLLQLLRGAPFLYNVQEIYPDVAVSLGVLTNRRAIRLLEALERFIYGRDHTLAEIIAAIAGAAGRARPRFYLPLRPVRWGVGLLEDGLRLIGRTAPIGRAMLDKYCEEIRVDGSRIQRELGFRPQTTLESGWQRVAGAARADGGGELQMTYSNR